MQVKVMTYLTHHVDILILGIRNDNTGMFTRVLGTVLYPPAQVG